MNNKWIQLLIAAVLWGFLAKNVIGGGSFLGKLFHNVAGAILPDQILGISGGIFLFIIFSLIYALLAYFVIFYAEKLEARKNNR